jgi:putative transcriptional regulator
MPPDAGEGSCKGRLLVAAPALVDPNFDRTVVLVLEHGPEGALGLVLNRPTDAGLGDALPDWAPLAPDPSVVFAGGPVAPDAVIALARAHGDDEGFTPVLDDLGSVDLGKDPFELGIPIEAVRVFAGYSGWAPGQLDDEVVAGGWFVVDAAPDDVFSGAPDDLWRDVLRRQRGRAALFAHAPLDPTAN